jgi:hypothetical protein
MIYFSKFGTVITSQGIVLQFQDFNKRLCHYLGRERKYPIGYRLHPACKEGRYSDYRRCLVPQV